MECREESERKVRPHPGPLPRGEGAHGGDAVQFRDLTGCRRFIGLRASAVLLVSWSVRLVSASTAPRSDDDFSLSPGERAGVRASVL